MTVKVERPKFPPCRLIYEGDYGPCCPECGSSFAPRYAWLHMFFKTDKCIQPECPNCHPRYKIDSGKVS